MTRDEMIVGDLPQIAWELRNVAVKRRKTPVAAIRRLEPVTITGHSASLSNTEQYVHLQVRRFAGSPNGQGRVRFRKKGDRLCCH